VFDDLPDNPLEQAKALENILIAACTGDRGSGRAYQHLRGTLIADAKLKPLLPECVRTCRDLEHFWGYVKGVSAKWEPRRLFIRNAFSPVFEYLEGNTTRPVDAVATGVLSAFDADAVHAAWEKALSRRHEDVEGAITSARTLLETVCKTVLEKQAIEYDEKDDLPALYKKVAIALQLAPSLHTEETFKRILGGCTSVVEGLGSLRNKLSDAHGRTTKAAPARASERHAQLAVNLAGAMATFIVQTWEARKRA
jgi:hypothetical protein